MNPDSRYNPYRPCDIRMPPGLEPNQPNLRVTHHIGDSTIGRSQTSFTPEHIDSPGPNLSSHPAQPARPQTQTASPQLQNGVSSRTCMPTPASWSSSSDPLPYSYPRASYPFPNLDPLLNPPGSFPLPTPPYQFYSAPATHSYFTTTTPKHLMGGAFYGSHDFSINNPLFQDQTTFHTSIHNNAADNFMEKFFEHTIKGAAHDSLPGESTAYVTRCHPGTRLATIQEIQVFVSNATQQQHLMWIVGPAGVGKTAVMRTAAETCPNIGASLFFSVNGRSDPHKALATLAYQFAIQYPTYFSYLQARVLRDPSIHTKVMEVQFNAFVIEPFVHLNLHKEENPVAVFVDGLDECDGKAKQCELLQLFSDLIIKHPSTPIVWVVASRPEPNITEFFETHGPIFTRIELSVTSDESRQTAEKLVRDSFSNIRSNSRLLRHLSQWPTEEQILKILAAADGLPAYASTVVRYIEDPNIGSPTRQLEIVLDVINNASQTDNKNPLAPLYALYDRILAGIPNDIWVKASQLLYLSGIIPNCNRNFDGGLGGHSELLSMSPDIAYGSLRHLYSVLIIPTLEDAMDDVRLWVHHKSFRDYLKNQPPNYELDISHVIFDRACSVLTDVSQGLNMTDARPWENITLNWPWEDRVVGQRKLHFLASDIIQEYWQLTCSRIKTRDQAFLDILRILHHGNLLHFEWLLDKDSIHIMVEKELLEEVPIIMVYQWNTNFEASYFFSQYQAKDEFQSSPRTGIAAYCCDWAFGELKRDYFARSRLLDSRKSCDCFWNLVEDMNNAAEEFPDKPCLRYTSAADNTGFVIYDFVDPDNPAIEWKYIRAVHGKDD